MNVAGYCLFCVSNAFAILLAIRLTRWFPADRFSAWLRLAVATTLYILICSLTTLAAGALGLLNAHAVTAVTGVLLLVEWGVLARRRSESLPRHAVEATPTLASALPYLKEASMVLAPALGLASWWLIRNLLMGTYVTNDDNTYHAATLAYWLKEGAITFPPLTYQAYYPYNGELLSLWYMLPVRSDAFVSLNGLVWLFLFTCLSVEYCRRLNVPALWRAVPLLLVLGSTPLFLGLTSFTDMDFSPPVALLAAALFSLAATDDEKPSISLTLLAGACAGFAVGMKVSCVPPVAVIGLVFLARSFRQASWAKRLQNWMIFGATAFLCGSFWYLRNWFTTGNPLYPAEIGPFAGPFTASEQSATKLIHVLREGLSPEGRGSLVRGFLNQPYPLFALYVAGFAVGIWQFGMSLIAKDKTPDTTKNSGLFVLVAAGAVTVLLFPVMPFSGRNEVGGLEVTGRYLNLIFLTGAILFPLALGSWKPRTFYSRLTVFLLVCATIVLPFLLTLRSAASIVIVTVTLAAFVLLECGERLVRSSPISRFAQANPASLFQKTWPLALGLVALSGPVNWRKTGEAAQVTLQEIVAELPPGSRVSMINHWLFPAYTLHGRRYQLQPMRLEADGQAMAPLHQRDLTSHLKGGETFWDLERPKPATALPADTFLENLRQSGIDFLVISRTPDGAWPEAAETLREATGATPWKTTESREIWDLRTLHAEAP